MNWNTIYITGKSDFREEVKKKLENSNLSFMPGYIDGAAGPEIHDLYWLDEKVELRNFKEAIGSKTIWKYRLLFFNSLEKFVESQNNGKQNAAFSNEELGLITEIQDIIKLQYK